MGSIESHEDENKSALAMEVGECRAELFKTSSDLARSDYFARFN